MQQTAQDMVADSIGGDIHSRNRSPVRKDKSGGGKKKKGKEGRGEGGRSDVFCCAKAGYDRYGSQPAKRGKKRGGERKKGKKIYAVEALPPRKRPNHRYSTLSQKKEGGKREEGRKGRRSVRSFLFHQTN